MLNFASFLRVLMLFEALLLVASLFLLAFVDGSESVGAGGANSALIVLSLAGTEAALGLSLLIHLNLSYSPGH